MQEDPAPHRFRCSLPRTSVVPPGSSRSNPPLKIAQEVHTSSFSFGLSCFPLLCSFPTLYVSTFAGLKSSFSTLADARKGESGTAPRPDPRGLRQAEVPSRAHAQSPRRVLLQFTPVSQLVPGTPPQCPGAVPSLRAVSLSQSALSPQPPLLFIASHSVFFFSLRPQFTSDKE